MKELIKINLIIVMLFVLISCKNEYYYNYSYGTCSRISFYEKNKVLFERKLGLIEEKFYCSVNKKEDSLQVKSLTNPKIYYYKNEGNLGYKLEIKINDENIHSIKDYEMFVYFAGTEFSKKLTANFDSIFYTNFNRIELKNPVSGIASYNYSIEIDSGYNDVLIVIDELSYFGNPIFNDSFVFKNGKFIDSKGNVFEKNKLKENCF